MKNINVLLAPIAQRLVLLTFAGVVCLAADPAFAYQQRRNNAPEKTQTFQIPATGNIEIAFSPNGGSEALIIKVIDAAKTDIRVLAYSFTSVPVVQALLQAKRRGVEVKVVADEKNNTADDRSGKARAAMSALFNAGIDMRLVSAFANEQSHR